MRIRLLSGLGLASLVIVLAGLSRGILSETGGKDTTPPPGPEAWLDSRSIVRADFDGDMKPDVAVGTAAGRGYVVQIQLSTQIPSASLTFASIAPGMRILSRDVNQDNDADLIVTSCTSLIPIAVFLGDGKGHFQPGNPWNYIPVGLNSPYQYDSPAGREGPAINTEEKRLTPGALCGDLAKLKLDAAPCAAPGTQDPAIETVASVRTPRGPPASTDL